MKRIILVIICMLMVVSCTKEKKCEIAKESIDYLTPKIEKGLECKNPDKIKESLYHWSEMSGLCKAEQVTEKGKIPAFICELLSAQIVKYCKSKIPKDWECTAENGSEKLHEILVSACEKI